LIEAAERAGFQVLVTADKNISISKTSKYVPSLS